MLKQADKLTLWKCQIALYTYRCRVQEPKEGYQVEKTIKSKQASTACLPDHTEASFQKNGEAEEYRRTLEPRKTGAVWL